MSVMIDQSSTPQEIEAFKAEFLASIKRVEATARARILARALIDGWSPSQAEWIDALAKPSVLGAVWEGVPLDQALEQAYGAARRAFAAACFDNALDEGKSRDAAFLAVIEIEREMAERRGEEPPVYSDTILQEACQAVQGAGEQGASTNDQIATGFATIRQWSVL